MTIHYLGLFPGQGSQKVGMGRDFAAASPLAQEIFAEANAALGFDLADICWNGPEDRLTSTEIAQPAILTVSTICHRLAAEHGVRLAAAAGHSLGEYSALVAAGAISFADAVLLVHKRGRYMQQAVPRGTGKMVAVIGQEIAAIEQAIGAVNGGVVQVANINAPGQIVVAGAAAAVDQFKEAMAGARLTELAVSAPFHCSLMQPAADQLKEDLAVVALKNCAFPVFSNYSAEPVTTPDQIRSALYLQVCGRVRWVECMQHAIAAHNITAAVEFGFGAVLTGLLKRIDPAVGRINANSLEAINSISC